MEVLFLGTALGLGGLFVREMDKRTSRQQAAMQTAVGNDNDFTPLFVETGPLDHETVYDNTRYEDNMRKAAAQAEQEMARVIRERTLYIGPELRRQYQHEQLGNRAVIERFSADLPESNFAVPPINHSGKREIPALFKPMPQLPEDAVGNLQKFQERAMDTLSGRRDGVPLKALAQPDIPIQDVTMRIADVMRPKIGAELNVKYRQESESKRNPNLDRVFEAPPVIAELPPARNGLAGRYNGHFGWVENSTLLQNQPNRSTEFVNKEQTRHGLARKRFDEVPARLNVTDAKQAGLAGRPYEKYNPLRERNGRPGYDEFAFKTVDGLGRFEPKDPFQLNLQRPDPTKKEWVLEQPNFKHVEMDKYVGGDHLQARPGPPRAVGRSDLLRHEPRLGLPDNPTRLIGQQPLLEYQLPPKLAKRETNMWNMDPDSGFVGMKNNPVWSVNDGRPPSKGGYNAAHAENFVGADGSAGSVSEGSLEPPRLNLREMLIHTPRLGQGDRTDLEMGSKNEPQLERDPKIYQNAFANYEPLRRTAESEVANKHVGDMTGIRQIAMFDGHDYNRAHSNIEASFRGPDAEQFRMSGKDFKARRQAVLEAGVAWPGEERH